MAIVKTVFSGLFTLAILIVECHGYTTPAIWAATEESFLSGDLKYKRFDAAIAPGFAATARWSRKTAVGALTDFRDTIWKSPDVMKTIYHSGLIENYLEYKVLFFNNWEYSKLSLSDFQDARNAYGLEGNWAVLHVLYYSLKGTSRVVWAIAILNSTEAVYKMGQAVVETQYYLLRYPVGGAIKTVAAPIAFTGGSLWSGMASFITTGWALPFSLTLDSCSGIGNLIWSN